MTTGYQIKDQTALYYLTFQIVDWIDVFTRRSYASLNFDERELFAAPIIG